MDNRTLYKYRITLEGKKFNPDFSCRQQYWSFLRNELVYFLFLLFVTVAVNMFRFRSRTPTTKMVSKLNAFHNGCLAI